MSLYVKTVLTINLNTVWNTGCVDTDDMDISNNNLRYSGIVQNYSFIQQNFLKTNLVLNPLPPLTPPVCVSYYVNLILSTNDIPFTWATTYFKSLF